MTCGSSTRSVPNPPLRVLMLRSGPDRPRGRYGRRERQTAHPRLGPRIALDSRQARLVRRLKTHGQPRSRVPSTASDRHFHARRVFTDLHLRNRVTYRLNPIIKGPRSQPISLPATFPAVVEEAVGVVENTDLNDAEQLKVGALFLRTRTQANSQASGPRAPRSRQGRSCSSRNRVFR